MTTGWTPPGYVVDAGDHVVGLPRPPSPHNWGRWGDDDERGTANLITPQRVRAAAGLVQTGRTISCAVPLDATGPTYPTRPGIVHLFRRSGADYLADPDLAQRTGGFQGSDDVIVMPLQGSTQWDALSHVFAQDTMYNGFWSGTVRAADGAGRCSIHQLKAGLTGRGVLLDLPRHFGLARLEPGMAIGPNLLDDYAQSQHVAVGAGDILILRTGHLPWWYELTDKALFWQRAPGLGMACVDWLHEHDIAAVGIDTVALEVEPHEDPGAGRFPVHVRLIRDLGMSLGEMWWLEELAGACADQRRYEFLLAAQPLNVTGGSGSPVNPLAIL